MNVKLSKISQGQDCDGSGVSEGPRLNFNCVFPQMSNWCTCIHYRSCVWEHVCTCTQSCGVDMFIVNYVSMPILTEAVTITASLLTHSKHENMRAVTWKHITTHHHLSCSHSQDNLRSRLHRALITSLWGSAAGGPTFTFPTASCIVGIQQ